MTVCDFQLEIPKYSLTLHPDKTHLGDCRVDGQGFEFLGYRSEAGKRWVRKKSVMSVALDFLSFRGL